MPLTRADDGSFEPTPLSERKGYRRRGGRSVIRLEGKVCASGDGSRGGATGERAGKAGEVDEMGV